MFYIRSIFQYTVAYYSLKELRFKEHRRLGLIMDLSFYIEYNTLRLR